MLRHLILIFALCSNFLTAASPSKIKAIYNSLDPNSLSQHLAFYELYPDSPEGKKALKDAWTLIANALPNSQVTFASLPPVKGTVDTLVALVNKQPDQETLSLDENELHKMERLFQSLPNRKLKGYYAIQEKEVFKLDPDAIDLARGLLLSQLPDTPDRMNKIRSYEAVLDLMTLQILTKVPMDAAPEKKIRAINDFIFDEMGFRFPPHSQYAKDIDLYTFLPSVIDSRRGVCLGVSILYLCLAQRMNLSLEMITPPGHIYVRYRNGERVINIETTARGVHIDSEDYLGIDTRSLEQRTIKEVIGMAHYNQASIHWQKNEYAKALASYEKALPYMSEDLHLKELMAYNYLFVGQKEEGEKILRQVVDYIPDYAISKQTTAEDYLKGEVDIEGIKPLFMNVDETRDSILAKKAVLEKVLEKYPRFRTGIFSLAATWLQLHRLGEAQELLERYHALDPTDPSAEYYLAVIHTERLDYNKAWTHLKCAEQLVKARNHDPKALKHLRKELSLLCPE